MRDQLTKVGNEALREASDSRLRMYLTAEDPLQLQSTAGHSSVDLDQMGAVLIFTLRSAGRFQCRLEEPRLAVLLIELPEVVKRHSGSRSAARVAGPTHVSEHAVTG